MWRELLERSHIDAEAVFHITLQHPLIRVVDFLHRNHFHVGDDVDMLADSSVWIAYLRGDDLHEVTPLTEALENGHPVWLKSGTVSVVGEQRDIETAQ